MSLLATSYHKVQNLLLYYALNLYHYQSNQNNTGNWYHPNWIFVGYMKQIVAIAITDAIQIRNKDVWYV